MSSIAAKLSVRVRIVVEVEHLQTELMLVQAAAGIAFVPGALARLSIDGIASRAATELWGLCARPPAIEIGEGGFVSLTPGAARSSFEL